MLLVSLSPTREKLLLEQPDLVDGILRERARTNIPGTIEFDDRFIELQSVLFDFAWKTGAAQAQAEALTPHGGELVYEDDTVEAARLLRAEQSRELARWVTSLPADLVAAVRRYESRSPATQSYAESQEPGPRPPVPELEAELARLKRFYTELGRKGHSLLAIRFRD